MHKSAIKIYYGEDKNIKNLLHHYVHKKAWRNRSISVRNIPKFVQSKTSENPGISFAGFSIMLLGNIQYNSYVKTTFGTVQKWSSLLDSPKAGHVQER